MTETATDVIRVGDLCKSYGPVPALRNVSIEISPGEIVGVLGPNGAGKTTLIECLLGLRQPDSGSFRIGNLDAFADRRAAKKLIGAQLQTSAVQDKITVREALSLISAFHERPTALEVLLERFALKAKANARYETLSGGEKQRLLLSLAFVHRPVLLLLDEPTVGLDPAARRELHRLITAQREEGRAVLLSTHYLDEAAQLCDRVAIIDHGRIVACSAPRALLARSQTLPRIRVRTTKPVEASNLPAVAQVSVFELESETVTTVVQTHDVGTTATALVQAIARAGNSLLDLQIEQPTLEDVFLELTGKKWSESAEEVARL